MSQGTILTSPVWSEHRNFHRFAIMVPQTCQAESAKVANLRAQLRELEEQIQDVEKINDKIQFLAKAELVTAIVMETSIGFLDLSAAIFAPINPAASKVAKAGAAAVKSTKDVGEYKMGKQNFAQLSTRLTKHSLSVAAPKSLAGKVMLNQAKTHVDAVKIAVDSMSGASKESLRKDGQDFVKDAGMRNIETIGDAMGEASKTAKVVAALSLLDGVYSAANDYNSALESRFGTYLDQVEASRSSLISQKQMLKGLMTRIKGLLEKATTDLAACSAPGV